MISAIDDITFTPYLPFSIGYTANTSNYCSTGTITLSGTYNFRYHSGKRNLLFPMAGSTGRNNKLDKYRKCNI